MVTVGMASGLGNAVFMLPTVKALTLAGQEVQLFVQTDFPTADLWRRCRYAKSVVEYPAGTNGHQLLAGEYSPAAWRKTQVWQFPLRNRYDCVWQSNLRLAQAFNYPGKVPDVSDWCRDLDRRPRWDVGVVPGCKGGYWIRKRWPGLADVAKYFLMAGLRVAVFGLPGDDMESVPGQHVETTRISILPDALAGCRVLVGGDSGVMHLGSSLGVPVVMIFTATFEGKADPVGGQKRKIASPLPCHPCVSTPRWPACRDWRCRDIKVEGVINAVNELLRGERWQLTTLL